MDIARQFAFPSAVLSLMIVGPTCGVGIISYLGASGPDVALAQMIKDESARVGVKFPRAVLFRSVILDVNPASLGSDCGAVIRLQSDFATGDPIYYETAFGTFSACDGLARSPIEVTPRTFKTMPCKPHYPENQQNKSCGGPSDEMEDNRFHLPLRSWGLQLQRAVQNLKSKGVEIQQPYDIEIGSASRISLDLSPPSSASSYEEIQTRLRSLSPDLPVFLFRGRHSRSGTGEATIAVIDAETGELIGLEKSTPLLFAPPGRPD